MKTILTAAALLCCTVLLAQAGALDSTFGNKGIFNFQPESYVGSIQAIAIQKDGKIVAAGTGYSGNTNQTGDFVIVRFNKNGTIDNSFGNNGKVLIDFSTPTLPSNDVAYGLSIQQDGKIVVAGSAEDYYIIDDGYEYNYYDMAIARVNPNGSLDTSFDADGKKLIDLSSVTFSQYNFTNYSYDYCRAVAVRPNGKIVMAGYAYVAYDLSGGMPTYEPTVLQLNKNGSFDTTFGTKGVKIVKSITENETVYGMALQQDGKIVLAGTQSSYSDHLYIIRLNTSGTIDKRFGTDGVVLDTALHSFGTSIAVQTDGKIVAGGYKYITYNYPSSMVARYNSDGSADKTFNRKGFNIYHQKNDQNKSWTLALQPDDKIVQTGEQEVYGVSNKDYYYGGTNFQIIKYNANGTLDSSFGAFGRSVIDFNNWISNFPDVSYACAIQSNNKIIAAGSTYGTSAVIRLQNSGQATVLKGPSNLLDTLGKGQCTISSDSLDPVLTPTSSDSSFSVVKYNLYSNGNMTPFDSGYGSVSGKPFNHGSTTVVYSLRENPLQRSVFEVNVTGGTPAGALDFDGIDDRVEINNMDPISNSYNNQYSFEAWIKVRAYNKEGSVIFGNERKNNGGIVVGLNPQGYISTYQRKAGNVISSYKVPLNKWVHIAFVQSSTRLNLYVNGNYVQTLLKAPQLHTSTSYNNTGYLGAYTSDNIHFNKHFNGKLEQVRIWRKAICQGQIENNMNCDYLSNYGGLYASYNFNQGIADCRNPELTIINGWNSTGLLKNFALDGPTSNWVKGYVNGTCKAFTPLTLECPDPINVLADSGSCSAVVNFAVKIYSGCSDSVTLTYSQNPKTAFPVGTTYVDVYAKNDFGDESWCQFPITVEEKVPPHLVTKDTSITLSNDGHIYIPPLSVVDTVYDNCNADQLSVAVNPEGLSCYDGVGTHTVTVTARDISRNATVKTAKVTVLPYKTTSEVSTLPSTQQYSDPTTLKATIHDLGNAYYNGCSPASGVTFKVGSKIIGTTYLAPEDYYYGNLIGTLNYTQTDLSTKKVTAAFNDVLPAFIFPNTVTTNLNSAPEDAIIEYIGSQLIETTAKQITLPVIATITDTADGYRGDIRKAKVTFIIKPVTQGAAIIGTDSITVPALEFLDANNTSGTARASFTISKEGNTNAKFNVTVKVGNFYTGIKSVPISVIKPAGLTTSNSASKLGNNKPGFDVVVYPNPSEDHYSILVQSSNKYEKITVKITDITGKVIEIIPNVSTSERITLGSTYASGTYIAEVSQGQNKKVFKLIKL